MGCPLALMQIKTYNVYAVFTQHKHRRFWSFFNRKGFDHVYMLIPVYYPEASISSQQYVMRLEYTARGVDLEIIWDDIENTLKAIPEHTDVLKYKVVTDLNQYTRLRGMLNCVSLTKATCLIQNWRIVTPFHLYRWMRMNGAKSLRLERSE